MSLQVHTVVSEPFAENTYLLWQSGRDDAIVVDPGFEPGAVLDALAERGLKPAVILNSHGHVDHIAGNAALKRAYPQAPLLIGTNDAPLLTDALLNMSGLYGFEVLSPPADRLVAEGEVLEYAGIRLEVLDVPGHSPGHVVFVIRGEPTVVIGGDVLFRGSVGRTDFPGGSFELLASGIRTKLWPLPDQTVVYPGHGPATTIGHEKLTNPFVGNDQIPMTH
jgi:glyoxylase-like metal-dependent hydrolase (beta-lactamase superfamily II)